MKKMIIPLVLALSLLLSAAGCGAGVQAAAPGETTTAAQGEGTVTDASITSPGQVPAADGFSAEDTDDSWAAGSSTSIALNGGSATVSGSGAAWGDGVLTISAAGTYVLAGTLDDGQIVVNAGKNDLVRLVLNSASISFSGGCPLYIAQADKTVIILPQGTQSLISDTQNYTFADGEDEPDAAVFAADDLSICGTGALTVAAQYRNGIASKDYLRISAGNITVTAANDCLRGRDGVYISGGSFTLSAQGDGIKSNYDTDAQKGFVFISGGDFDITAGCDGIQAETTMQISGGRFNIISGGGQQAAPVRQSENMGWGGWQNQGATTTAQDEESRKGLKAGVSLAISGGVFHLDCYDDGVHTNGDMTIAGGQFTVSTGDDAFHADGSLVVDDGTIDILASYEGIEGKSIDINGGIITIAAADDGINASSGDSQATMFVAQDGVYIRITGGVITINCDADGIDSNGNLYIDGGEVYVTSSVADMESPLDADGAITVTGGTTAALGPAGQFQVPGSASTQYSVVICMTAAQPAGQVVELRGPDGQAVAAITSAKQWQVALFTSPALLQGDTYDLYIDGQRITSVTLTAVITSVYENGEAYSSSAPGGGMRPGGGRGQQGNQQGTDGQGFTPPEGFTPPDGSTLPNGSTLPDGSTLPSDFQPPEGFTPPDGSTLPNGFQPPQGGQAPPDGQVPTTGVQQ